jgi:hypothetical protein
MTAIKHLQFQTQALQRYRRRIKALDLDPSEASRAARTADRLEATIRAQWGVRFSAFLRRVNGRGRNDGQS